MKEERLPYHERLRFGLEPERERGVVYSKCWDLYAKLLRANGVDPAERKAEFDEEWALSMGFLSQEDAVKVAEVLAKEVAARAVPLPPKLRPPPPMVPVPRQGLERLIWDFNTGKISLEEYRRRARELQK